MEGEWSRRFGRQSGECVFFYPPRTFGVDEVEGRGLHLPRISGRLGSYRDHRRVRGMGIWGRLPPPGVCPRNITERLRGPRPSPRYPRPLPALLRSQGRAHSRAPAEMLKKCPPSMHWPQFPAGRGACFCYLPPPTASGVSPSRPGVCVGTGVGGVPGPTGWWWAELRRRRTESQHSPWAGRGRGSAGAALTQAPGRLGQQPLAASGANN